MDTVNYEMIKQINRDMISNQTRLQDENKKMHDRNKSLIEKIEKLSKNENLKYLNFKVIGIAVAVGLLLGFTSGGLVFSNFSKSHNTIQYDFYKKLSEEEFKKQKFDIYQNNEFACKINGKRFEANDVINGWMFRKTVPSWKKLIFTDPAETKSFAVDLK